MGISRSPTIREMLSVTFVIVVPLQLILVIIFLQEVLRILVQKAVSSGGNVVLLSLSLISFAGIDAVVYLR